MSKTAMNHELSQPSNRTSRKKVLSFVGAIVGAILIFITGWGVGNGRLTLDKVKTLNADAPSQLNYSEVDELYGILKNRYDGKLDQQALLDGMKTGLIEASGDPYTQYFNAKDAKEFTQQLKGTIIGIGAQLGKSSDGYIEIISPVNGSPAAKAGIKAKDIVAEVNGESTSGWGVDKAVSKIRGDKGTKVTLTIVREGSDTQKIEITRDEITMPSVESEILANNIGYIKINQFSEDTNSLSLKAAQQFKAAGVKGVVLDLRGNPGGLVDSSVSVASLWLPKNKTILEEKRDKTVIKTYYANGTNPLVGIPTRVLIDGGSASASEIVAGALKDNNAAVLVGTKSYGKGSVQELKPLDNGTLVKITIARWYRPNGKNIDKEGITPDKIIEITADQFGAGQDPQKDAAIAELK